MKISRFQKGLPPRPRAIAAYRLSAWLLLLLGFALAASVALLGSRAGAAPQALDYNAVQLRILEPESYVDLAGIWEKHRLPIPVCWEQIDSAHQQEREWVESIIATALEGPTSVRFRGSASSSARWPQCKQGDLGIRIAVADVEPWSEVGQQWTTRNQARAERATRMTLNLDYQQTWFDYCSKHKKQCVQVIGLHEFMHAIGFLHEHLRSDAPEQCKKEFAHKGDFAGYQPMEASKAYDQWSIMNYCESIYREPIKLSTVDVETVEKMYTGSLRNRTPKSRALDR
jgi:hypothetical protein